MGDARFEHLAAEPADGVRNDRLADRGEGEPAAHLAHRLVVGVAQRRRCEGGVAEGHLWSDVPAQRHSTPAGSYRHVVTDTAIRSRSQRPRSWHLSPLDFACPATPASLHTSQLTTTARNPLAQRIFRFCGSQLSISDELHQTGDDSRQTDNHPGASHTCTHTRDRRPTTSAGGTPTLVSRRHRRQVSEQTVCRVDGRRRTWLRFSP